MALPGACRWSGAGRRLVALSSNDAYPVMSNPPGPAGRHHGRITRSGPPNPPEPASPFRSGRISTSVLARRSAPPGLPRGMEQDHGRVTQAAFPLRYNVWQAPRVSSTTAREKGVFGRAEKTRGTMQDPTEETEPEYEVVVNDEEQVPRSGRWDARSRTAGERSARTAKSRSVSPTFPRFGPICGRSRCASRWRRAPTDTRVEPRPLSRGAFPPRGFEFRDRRDRARSISVRAVLSTTWRPREECSHGLWPRPTNRRVAMAQRAGAVAVPCLGCVRRPAAPGVHVPA